MKYIKKFENLNEYSADLYVEVTFEDALSWCKGKPLPSKYPIPLNDDIIEYGAGNDINGEATEGSYKEIAMDKCDWYDGTEESVKNGLNAVNDFDYAAQFDSFILGVKTISESAEFSSLHVFIKDYTKIKLIFVYDCKREVFIKPENFEKYAEYIILYNDTEKYNL